MKIEDASAIALILQLLTEQEAIALCTENLLLPVTGELMGKDAFQLLTHFSGLDPSLSDVVWL